jgi:hypothetical protein
MLINRDGASCSFGSFQLQDLNPLIGFRRTGERLVINEKIRNHRRRGQRDYRANRWRTNIGIGCRFDI